MQWSLWAIVGLATSAAMYWVDHSRLYPVHTSGAILVTGASSGIGEMHTFMHAQVATSQHMQPTKNMGRMANSARCLPLDPTARCHRHTAWPTPQRIGSQCAPESAEHGHIAACSTLPERTRCPSPQRDPGLAAVDSQTSFSRIVPTAVCFTLT
jgi:hypothetical protein